jgi:hypothetical protein
MLHWPSAGLWFNGQRLLWDNVLHYRTHIQPEHCDMLTGILQHNQASTIHEIYVIYDTCVWYEAMEWWRTSSLLPYHTCTGDITAHNMLTPRWVHFSQQADEQHKDDCKHLCPQLGQMMDPHIQLLLSSYNSSPVARQGYMKRYPIKYN